MTKNKYATIQDLVPNKNFDFFNNFSDQVFKTNQLKGNYDKRNNTKIL